MNRTIAPEDLARAEQMIAEGAQRKDVTAATGISEDTLRKRFGKTSRGPAEPAGRPSAGGESSPTPPRRRRDPAPRVATASPSGKRRRVANKPQDDELETMLRTILKTASLPMRLKCDFCADYMAAQAAVTANRAIQDPDLRNALVFVWDQWNAYAGYGVLVAWMGVPMLHHLAPDFIYRGVAPLVGMPPRTASTPAGAATGHRHAPAANGTSPPAPPPPEPTFPAAMPFGFPDLANVDTDQLVGMARSMGIEIDPAMLQSMIDADASTATAETGSDDAPAAAGTEAPASPDAAGPDPEL